MRKVYPSDISTEQFKEIEPILTEIRKQTKPREIDLYDVFCTILYVVRSCCQWRMLPSDFPKWQTVYSYFRMWKEQENDSASVLEVVLKKMVEKERTRNGRNGKTSFVIVDAQSVKNTDTAEQKGYDGGKKVSGIKRHIAVDTKGLPHGICITTADVTDRDGTIIMFESDSENFSRVENVLTDGGYLEKNLQMQLKKLLMLRLRLQNVMNCTNL